MRVLFDREFCLIAGFHRVIVTSKLTVVVSVLSFRVSFRQRVGQTTQQRIKNVESGINAKARREKKKRGVPWTT